MRIHSIPSLLSALTLTIGLASAQKPVEIEGQVRKAEMVDRNNLPPIAPVSVSGTVEQVSAAKIVEASAGGATVPEAVAAWTNVWSGTLDAEGTEIMVKLGTSKKDAELPDSLAIDLDADGKIGSDEVMPFEVSSRDVRGNTLLQGAKSDLKLQLNGTTMEAALRFQKYGPGAPRITLQIPSYLHAEIGVGGEPHVIAVQDADLDGTFGSEGDRWHLATPGGRPASAYALSTLGEKRFVDGKLIGIAVEGKKIKVSMDEADGPRPQDLASHRHRVEQIWMDRFDEERAEFVEARGLDTSRTLAKEAVDWKYVSFEEGLELAKKTGKPMFVDAMAFWCVWCYRLDYYTYPDAEVANLLNEKFVPVKIIQEQAGDDYDMLMKKLEARGIPAMGIFKPDGTKVHTIGGWKKPEDFVSELKTGLEKAN